MSQDESVTYLSRQVADELGVGVAMLRRYASAYEQTTGEEIKLDRRIGRLFTSEQVQALRSARELVMRTGLSVEQAIQRTVGTPEGSLEPLRSVEVALDTQQLAVTLEEAHRRANEPLLDELRELRGEVSRLREEIQSQPPALPSAMPHSRPATFGAGDVPEDKPEPPSDARAGSGTTTDGPLVRLAKRLERIMGRG